MGTECDEVLSINYGNYSLCRAMRLYIDLVNFGLNIDEHIMK